jgi:hypothetical protein
MKPTQLMRRLWVCSCSGYRFASLVKQASGGQKFVTDLVVHDFNPQWWADGRPKPSPEAGFVGAPEPSVSSDAASNIAEPGAQVRAVGGDAPELVKSDAWDHIVATRLPYRTVTRRLRDNPKGVMIDDQRIMLVDHLVPDHDWLGMIQHVQTWCM